MRRSIALFGAAAPFSLALAPPAPSPTDPLVGGVDLRGMTPKPTTAPALHPELARRQDSQSLLGYFAPDNTCGYVNGLLGGIKTCDSTQRCAAVIIGGVATMGCCDTDDESCTWLGNCIGYRGYWSSSLCDHACQQDINTVKCTSSAYPFCYSYMVPGASIGFYSCDSTSYSRFDVFQTTFAGETDGRTWKKVYDTSGAASSSRLLAAGTLGTVGAFTITESPAAPASVPSGNAEGSTTHNTGTISKQGKKKTPVGAIAGGVVGGLVVIGALIAGLVFFLLKRKNNKSTPVNGAAAAAPAGTAPPQGPDMSQQQPGQFPPQGQYPQGQYDPQNPANGPAPGYFAMAGKMDQPYPQQQQQGGYSQKDGLAVTEQQVPVTPQPPQSPAPPYSQPVQGMQPQWAPSPVSSPPPPQAAEIMTPVYQQAQQPQGPPPQQQPIQPQQPMQQAPAELGTTYGVPTYNRDGRPVFEAA